MSSMEVFIGTINRCEKPVYTDEDDFYDQQRETGKYFVEVDGKWWRLERLVEVDEYGFQTILDPTKNPVAVFYWYNGGGSLHEVAEIAIRNKYSV